jgi:hypothetical protein
MLAQHARHAYQGCGKWFRRGCARVFGHIANIRRSRPGSGIPSRLRRSETLAFAFCALLTLAVLAAVYAIWPSARRDDRDRQRREDDDRFTRSLAGLAMAFLLLVVGLWLTERLADVSKLDDCMLQGRSNCERIELSVVR